MKTHKIKTAARALRADGRTMIGGFRVWSIRADSLESAQRTVIKRHERKANAGVCNPKCFATAEVV